MRGTMLAKEKTKLKQGYVMRPVNLDDAEIVVELVNAVSQALHGVNEVDVAEFENFWATPGLDLEKDLRIVISPQGKAVGYIEAFTFNDPPVHPFIWIRVHPDHGEDGLGKMMMAWALERVSNVLDRVPQDLRVSVQTFAHSGDKIAKKVIEEADFDLVRLSFIMHIDLESAPSAPDWPTGISLLPFEADKHAEMVYRAHDDSFADHYGHLDQPFESGFARFKHQMIEDKTAFDPELWFVAMDGDEVAGISICRINRQEDQPRGWVNILGVRRPWRKRGLGMALLKHSFAEFYKRGLRRGGLGVDASSLTGAVKLYERAGMHVAQQYDRYEKELRPGKELMTTEVSE
jgi:mycothiol synthase